MAQIISNSIDIFLYLSIPLSLVAGLLFFFLPYSLQSRLCFAGLMFFYALALIRVTLMHIGWIEAHPTAFFFPLWYTLSFGILIFYAIKMRLYPSYKLRWTDFKHFILPILQAGFFWFVFLKNDAFKLSLLADFIPNSYKLLEGTLFILLFFSYILMAFRYIKFYQAILRKRQRHAEADNLENLRRMVKILFILGGINTSYILSDFFAWNFLGLNLYTVKGFASLNDLSFAAMGWWLAWFAYREWRKKAILVAQ